MTRATVATDSLVVLRLLAGSARKERGWSWVAYLALVFSLPRVVDLVVMACPGGGRH